VSSDAGAVARACVSFRLSDRSPKRKTETWTVWNLRDASYLGQVRWRWRQYCFFSSSATRAMDADCLRGIAGFTERETEKRRKGRRAFCEASE